jgi:hypothetical protein
MRVLEPTVAPEAAAETGVDTEAEPRRSDRSDRWAAWAFGAYVLAAFPLILFGLGRYWWFFRDDWYFITDRDLSAQGLFDDHNGHWSTAPILVFRALWSVFGLTTYAPYKATVIVAHLVVAVCLRGIMRRYEVRPWLATAVAAALVLFGPGREDIIWAFQIGFTGSIAMLLLQWLLADRPEAGSRIDRRDLLGVACGLVAVSAASPALPLVAALAATTFVRRGWRAAVVHAGPTTAAYLLWSAIVKPVRSAADRPPVDALADWVGNGVSTTFEELTGYRWAAALMAIAVVAGLVVALVRPRGEVLSLYEPAGPEAGLPTRLMAALRFRLTPIVGPLAMFLAAVLFILLAAQRAWFFGAQAASASRYLYAYTAFTLPLIGLAIQKLADRWRYAAPALVLLLAIAVPSNVRAFRAPDFGPPVHAFNRDFFTNVVRSPAIEHAPEDLRPDPDPFVSEGLDVGFFLDAQEEGKLPETSRPIPSQMQPVLKIRLGLEQESSGWVMEDCEITEVERLRPEVGDRFYLYGSVFVRDNTHDGPQHLVSLNNNWGNLVTVVAPDLDLKLWTSGDRPAVVCMVG